MRYAVPAAFESREFVAAGGLARCAGSYIDSFRGAGVYVGRILKGEKPSELPVPAKIKLFLDLKTARALGLTIPLPLLARADEVFE